MTFREQAINTCLNFLAVNEYKNIVKDKKIWNYDEINDEILATPQRFYNDDDNLKNNQNKEQNKVSKRLMSNTNINATSTLSRQNQLSLRYLSKLYDNNVNATTNTCNMDRDNNETYKAMGAKQRRQYNKSIDMMLPGSSVGNNKRHNLEDDLPRTTSSDEYETPEEAGTSHIKNNIFSYKEKNFEEDDIMDLDELKDAITINIPSTCKEHKCSFCLKRFMFEESFGEHIKTCIEYKFATFLEEMNNLLYIRRAKEISPHEFIRRMIFSLRKTCEWLKENCIDTTLPDLLPNNQTISNANKEGVDSECKSTTSSSTTEKLSKRNNNRINRTNIITSPLLLLRPTAARNTPINMSNNILHEIERSESRNSQNMTLKKPIAILATSAKLNNVNNLSAGNQIQTESEDSERLAFMEKLQNAAKPVVKDTKTSTPTKTLTNPVLLQTTTNPSTPLISVRQDLLATINNNHTSPLLDLLRSSSRNSSTTVANPCARCPQCNLFFDTLDGLEVHNAMQHNSMANATNPEPQDDLDFEHKRIIALFEDDDI